jgi:LPXTG-site transpeptidase (sortase) family protein
MPYVHARSSIVCVCLWAWLTILPIPIHPTPTLLAQPAESLSIGVIPTMGVNDVTEGTLLFKTNQPGRYTPAPILKTDVHITVTGIIARATVRQEFTNPEGAYGRTLAFGPGHVESTGPLEESSSIILTGHRDTHFRFLETLQAGETILLQTQTGVWHRFMVRDRRIVDSRTARISIHEDKRHLILVTCYPFAAIVPRGPLRYVVIAEL